MTATAPVKEERGRRLPAPQPGPDGGRPSYDVALSEALETYQSAVVRLSSLDLVTAELVRLRCARTHDCRVCQAVRVGAARDAGVDDTMTAKIDNFEASDLPEHQKVALRLTDAFITQPNDISAELRAQVRKHFSDEQIVELMLDITKWSTQKLPVALGLDAAPHPDGSLIDFDEAGHVIWGPPIER